MRGADRIRAGTVRPHLALLLSALAMAAVLGTAFVAPMPLWIGQPPAGPGQAGQTAEGAGLGALGILLTLLFAALLTVPFRPYLLAVRASRGTAARNQRLILLLTVLLAAFAFLIYPRFGTDVFEYIAYERLAVVYHENPLLARPALHIQDWAAQLAWYPERPLAYGPLWHLLAMPVAWASRDSVLANVVGFKLLAAAGYALCAWLVWSAAEPDDRAMALVTFAWSPLVLFEVLGKGHNDVLLAGFLVASVWLATGRAKAGGLVLAAAAALVKVSAAAAGPPIVKRLVLHRSWAALVLGAALSTLLAAALYGLFWAGPQVLFPVLSQVSRVVWSPGTLLVLGAQTFGGSDPTFVVRGVLAAAWLAGCAWAIWRFPVETRGELATASCVLLLITLGLLTTAFFAHYLVPAIALAAISGNRLLQSLVVALSLGSLAAYSVEILALSLGSSWIGSPGYQLLGSVVTLAPALCLIVWHTVNQAPKAARLRVAAS